MESLFFYIFSAIAVISAVLVIWNPFSRNTVNNAMFLVTTMLSISGLFVMLQAYFLAAVQVIVYAGAVMVLFLFVIMLLDIQEEKKRRLRLGSVGIGVILAAFVSTVFYKAFGSFGMESTGRLEGTTSALGSSLFVNFLLPFEIISVLLLVAMLGAILLSKKYLK